MLLSETLTLEKKIYYTKTGWFDRCRWLMSRVKSLEKCSSSHISCKIASGNMWPPSSPVCGAKVVVETSRFHSDSELPENCANEAHASVYVWSRGGGGGVDVE